MGARSRSATTRIEAALLVAMAGLGCNRGVDLGVEFDEGDTLNLAFTYTRGARVALEDGFVANWDVTGTRTVEVEQAGVLGRSTVVLVDRTTALSVEQAKVGAPLVWTLGDGERPVSMAPVVDPFLGDPRRVTLPSNGEPTTTPERKGTAADVDAILEGLRHAPDGRVKLGSGWYVERGDDRYRSWTVTELNDLVLVIEEENRTGDPFEGELPDEQMQRRSRLTFDRKQGVPATWRMRDLGNSLLATDVEVTLTWE